MCASDEEDDTPNSTSGSDKGIWFESEGNNPNPKPKFNPGKRFSVSKAEPSSSSNYLFGHTIDKKPSVKSELYQMEHFVDV